MSGTDGFVPGTLVWQDLTVGPAEAIRDFYQQVVGGECRALCRVGWPGQDRAA